MPLSSAPAGSAPGAPRSADVARAAPVVARIERRDERRAAAVLARAFRDGPISRAVVGGDPRQRLRSNRHGMRVALRGARSTGSVLQISRRGATRDSGAAPLGILLAIEPGLFPLDPPSLPGQLYSAWVQGVRVATRWGLVYRALEAVHPRDPHWYLSLLGVDPVHQGRGLGRALLDAWLAEVDRGGQPSYLETDREANLRFYARAGFGVARQTEVLGVRIFCLWRPGRLSP